MRKVFKLFLIFSFCCLCLLSQEYVNIISIKDYKGFINQIKVEGFSLSKIEIDGDSSKNNISYLGMFKSIDNQVVVSLSDEKEYFSFFNFKDTARVQKLKFNKYDAVYYPVVSGIGMFTILCIHIPEVKASFSITYPKLIQKEGMLKILEEVSFKLFEDIEETKKTLKLDKNKDIIDDNGRERVYKKSSNGWWWY